ncbi:MAG TPA: enolase C-terminal domain-like protein [Candidatus Binatia bacterium]|nr:enolase C-terminal domain-like protein [Candidatus Binatia bacterium]
MKIECIEIFQADIPFRAVSGAPLRTWNDSSAIVIVRMYADGIMGVGTATAIGFYLGLTGGALVETARALAPHLVGLPPFNIQQAHARMDHYLKGNQAVKAAFDIAMYDLMGKITGRPVYDLLGGRMQTEPLPTTTFALYLDEPEKMAADARDRYEDGFRAFEVKMGDPALDVERIRAIREAIGPQAILVADANGHWTVKDAIRIAQQLAPYDVLIEEPCHGITALEEIRHAVPVPVIADETCHTVQDAAEIARRRAADIVSIKLLKAGGLWRAHQMALLLDAAGLGCRVDGVRGETRVSNTASAHLATSLARPIAPGLMQHARLAKDVVTAGGLHFASGHVSVNDDPGLGLEAEAYGELVETFEA